MSACCGVHVRRGQNDDFWRWRGQSYHWRTKSSTPGTQWAHRVAFRFRTVSKILPKIATMLPVRAQRGLAPALTPVLALAPALAPALAMALALAPASAIPFPQALALALALAPAPALAVALASALALA